MEYTARYLSVIVAYLSLLLPASPSAARCNDCWLVAQGTEIVNASTGQPVRLRTVGLGGWLLQEGYMMNPGGCEGCPGTQWEMKRQYLQEGLTIEQVESFYQQWRDNFITRADIDYIASLGFNSVRLPMHYELFLTTEQRGVRNEVISDLFAGHDRYKDALRGWVVGGTLAVDADLEGFRMIDRLVDWCEANGMYVILDMHAAPGAQGTDRNIADGFFGNNLWEFPVFQDVLDRMWKAISDRYKDEPRIAMYEFINEPNNVPGGGPAIHALTQRLLTTVRNNGDNHMIGVHGNGWGNVYDYLEPFTLTPNWGLVYSAHRYGTDLTDDWAPAGNPNIINRIGNMINFRDTHSVPIWVGETGENTPDWLAANIGSMEAAGVGWCHWTYKRHDWQENAALMRIGGNYPTDGANAMATVLESIRFENLMPNTNTRAAVTATLPAPGATGCLLATGDCEPPIGQAIWIKGSNDRYVSSEDGAAAMRCNRITVTEREVFTVVDAGNGRVALRGSNGLFVSSEDGQSPMVCDRETAQAWETFDWIDLGTGAIALRGSNGRFVSSLDGTAPMMCDREIAQGWEAFTFGTGPACAADLALPYGVIDLADINAFISGFTTLQGIADLDGNGIFDLGDIAAFISAFNAGCP